MVITTRQSTKRIIRKRSHSIVELIATTMFVLIGQTSVAQTLPSSPPPGGLTAPPINLSANTQQKTGSVIIGGLNVSTCANGSQATCAALCLNASSSTDATNCIKTWTDIVTIGSGAYVQLQAAATPTFGRIGYARLKGNSSQANPYTFHFGFNAAPAPTALASGLYADAVTSDNYAGYFDGTIDIESPTQLAPGAGKICLNGLQVAGSLTTGVCSNNANTSCALPSAGNTCGTGNTCVTDGKYCISSWSDIQQSALSNKLTLQPQGATVSPEAGHVNVSQAFNAGSFSIGTPLNLPASGACGSMPCSCGDGICQANETAVAGANYCPVDCNTVNILTGFSTTPIGGIPGQNWMNITTTWQSQKTATINGDNNKVYVLIVRSTNQNFSFTPQDGTLYSVGGDSDFAVAYAGFVTNVVGGTTFSKADVGNGLVSGTTFYYRAYEGNNFPRYTPASAPTAYIPSSAKPN